MNFIGRTEGGSIQVELKYCERCGGLWLRPQGTDGVYCAGCQLRLRARPDPCASQPRNSRERKANSRTINSAQIVSLARIGYLQGVAAMEVGA
jgi:hypothetical protein